MTSISPDAWVICADAPFSASSALRTCASKLPICASTARWRSAASVFWRCWSCSIAALSAACWRNTASAPASAPISSFRSANGACHAQIAARELQHGIAQHVQRANDPPADRHDTERRTAGSRPPAARSPAPGAPPPRRAPRPHDRARWSAPLRPRRAWRRGGTRCTASIGRPSSRACRPVISALSIRSRVAR